MTAIVYTEGQEQALHKINQFLEGDETRRFFVLSGSAGTGKTHLTEELCKGREFVTAFTAPTNKAAQVLAERVDPSCLVCTIHRFLGLTVKQKKDKTITVRSGSYDPETYRHISHVFLDEASMTNAQLAAFIQEDAINYGRKYVLVGDLYQLPPPNSEGGGLTQSPVFEWGEPEDRANLTEIVRQARDNPIIQTATRIRDAITNKVEPPIVGGTNDGIGVHKLRRPDWEDKLQEICTRPEVDQDSDFFRVISWRNKKCMEYSQKVREFRGEDLSIPFGSGDTVVVNQTFAVGEMVLFNTGAEVNVLDIQPARCNLAPDLECFKVLLDGFDEAEDIVEFLVLSPRSWEDYNDKLAESVRLARTPKGSWGNYRALKETFIDLRPPYAITAHKSQGSTYSHVFIDVSDIYRIKVASEADRAFYVAVTRASQSVYILS